MRTPDKWSPYNHGGQIPRPTVPATPTVYPVDDHVREGLLGPDGKPVADGTRRRHPIGFTSDRPQDTP